MDNYEHDIDASDRFHYYELDNTPHRSTDTDGGTDTPEATPEWVVQTVHALVFDPAETGHPLDHITSPQAVIQEAKKSGVSMSDARQAISTAIEQNRIFRPDKEELRDHIAPMTEEHLNAIIEAEVAIINDDDTEADGRPELIGECNQAKTTARDTQASADVRGGVADD